MLTPVLIAFSIAVVLAFAAGAVYLMLEATGVFLVLLGLVAGYVSLAYWRVARAVLARRKENQK
jgi:hypothetical protein